MPQAPLSTFLGRSTLAPSISGERSSFYLAKPTTGDVVSAFVEETFQGEGSLSQDLRATEIEQADKRGISPLTQEEWKSSDYHRPGLSYYEGMTEQAARILSEVEDDRNDRNLIIAKSSTWQKAVGFGAAFLAGIPEPKNLASGIAAAGLTAGIGGGLAALAGTSVRAARVLKMANNIGKYKKLAAVGAAEGAVATAITEPSNRESSKIVQGDYTLADSLLNFTLSTVLGAGLHAAPVAIRDYRLRKKELALKEFDTAIDQLTEGKAVSVDHVDALAKVQEVAEARAAVPKLAEEVESLHKQEAATPGKAVPDSFLASVFDSGKVPEGITAPELINLAQLINDQPKKPETLLAFLRKSGGLKEESGELAALGVTTRTRPGVVNNQKGMQFDDAALKAWEHGFFPDHAERPTVNEFLQAVGEDYRGERLVIRQKDYHYFDRLAQQGDALAHAESIGVNVTSLKHFARKQKLKARQSKDIATTKRTDIDTHSIDKAVGEMSNRADSSAYADIDPRPVEEILEQYGKIPDERFQDEELELLREQVAEMQKEGQLTEENVKMLQELEEIQRAVEAEEAAINSAFLCITMG